MVTHLGQGHPGLCKGLHGALPGQTIAPASGRSKTITLGLSLPLETQFPGLLSKEGKMVILTDIEQFSKNDPLCSPQQAVIS